MHFRAAGLEMIIKRSALIGSLLLWAVFVLIALVLIQLSVVEALIGGLVAVVLYWSGEVIHQLGHAWAAKRTGYPMFGILYGTFFVLGTSLYPRDEPALPGAVHIRRALGVPLFSLIVLILSALITALLPQGTLLWWLVVLVLVSHILVFFGGALLPLSFTDGGTLLHWWNKRS